MINIQRLGNNERNMLLFAARYAGTWNSYSHDRATSRAAMSLARKGLINVNGFHQFTVTPAGVETAALIKD